MGATGRSNFMGVVLIAAIIGFNPSWVPPAGLIEGRATLAPPPPFQSLMGATGRSNILLRVNPGWTLDSFNPSWVPPAGLIYR